MYITTQEETILSYLVGLAPMGEVIFVKVDQIFDDVCDIAPVRTHNRLAQIIAKLVALRIIKRFSRSRYIVLHRPEEYDILTANKGWQFKVNNDDNSTRRTDRNSPIPVTHAIWMHNYKTRSYA